MEMFGHENVSGDDESISLPRFFQDSEKQFTTRRTAEPMPALITTRSDKMQVARTVVSLQSQRHSERLCCVSKNCCDEMNTHASKSEGRATRLSYFLRIVMRAIKPGCVCNNVNVYLKRIQFAARETGV